MTFSKALALAGLTLIAGAAPGWAADWGGVRDMGGGVAIPVPAPAPVPTYDYDSDWYVGLAIGANISQSAKINGSDINMPLKDSGDIGASPIFSGSFGRYITPSLRAEAVFDYSAISAPAAVRRCKACQRTLDRNGAAMLQARRPRIPDARLAR